MGIEKQQARYETKKVSETKYEVEDGSVHERLVDNDRRAKEWSLWLRSVANPSSLQQNEARTGTRNEYPTETHCKESL